MYLVNSIDLKLFEGLDTLLPEPDTSKSVYIWIEPECSTVGENWELIIDPQVSNQSYAIVEQGINSNSSAPADSASAIYMSFTVPKDSSYCIFVRLNSSGSDDDSFWAKLDDEDFVLHDGLGTSGWEWKKLDNYSLAAGEHTLTIAHGEDGSNLDKLCITNDTVAPIGLGKPSDIVCMPDTTTPAVGIKDVTGRPDNFILGQNYPNPFTDMTTITFEIPLSAYVSMKVYSVLGEEIAELAGKEYASGLHSVEFDATGLSKGIYFYMIETNKYSASRKMIIQVN